MSFVLTYMEPGGQRTRIRRIVGVVEIGRVFGAIRLDDPSVSPLHAEIDATDEEGPILRKRSEDGAIWVNGALSESATLRRGDRVHVGDVELLVSSLELGRNAEPTAAMRTDRPRPPAPAAVLAPAVEAVRAPRPTSRPLTSSPVRAAAAPSRVMVHGGTGSTSRSARRRREAPIWMAAFGVLVLAGFGVWLASRRVRPTTSESRAPVARSESRTKAPVPTAVLAAAAQPVVAAVPSPSAVEASPASAGPSDGSSSALGRALESVVSITGRMGSGLSVVGSGFLASGHGYVVTNAHVIDGADELFARLHDGRKLPAHPVRMDREADLGLLKLLEPNVPKALPFGTTAHLTIGQTVFAIGSPMAEELSFTVTRGIVSAPVRSFALDGAKARTFVQHDAAINPGNSGGPLIDVEGRVLGMNTWKVVGGQGLGFAIPVEEVAAFLARTDPP